MIPDVSKECSALLDSWTVGDEGVVGYCQWHGVTPQTRLEPSACSIRSSRHRQTVREYWLLDWSELRARAREQGNGMLPLMRFRCSVPMQARQAADCRSCVALQDWGCVALQDWGCVALQEWGRAALQEWVVWHYRSGGCFVAPQELGCVALQEWVLFCGTTGVRLCGTAGVGLCHYRSRGCFVALQASGCVAPQKLGCVALQEWGRGALQEWGCVSLQEWGLFCGTTGVGLCGTTGVGLCGTAGLELCVTQRNTPLKTLSAPVPTYIYVRHSQLDAIRPAR